MGVRASIFWTFAFLSLAQCYVDKTVYQYLVDNGYSSFVQLLKDTHQDKLLMGPGPVTVFAPTNIAVGRLNPDILASIAHNPFQISSLVKYHVVSGYVLLPTLAGSSSLMTSAGQKLNLLRVGHSLILNNRSRVDSPPGNDIICNNGVVQPIDSVLVPPLYSEDNLFAVLVERDDLFQEFLMSILLANLTHVIESGEYTVFAPVDPAYVRYIDRISNPLNLSTETVKKVSREMYKYHIVPGARFLDTLKHGQILYTLHGTPLNISVLTSGYMVNQAKIIHGDIPASNGVIHGLNDVLFPMDLLATIRNDTGNQPTPRGR